jgi:3-phosphoshikimate 1-carboxyvinyltransferase
MVQEFNRIEKVNGELNLPGDKSVSHRAVIFSAMADGVSEITNLSDGEDVNSTITCMESIGAATDRTGRSVKVLGKGFKKFTKPNSMLNAGNSGTTTRLLSGLLAAQNFDSIIIGDDSLSKRPMERVINPLQLMGANIESTSDGTLPLKIFPVKTLNPIDYYLPVASAQVKSAVLIAALHCDGITSVTDKYATRDHTERMLNLKTSFLPDSGGRVKVIYSSKENYPEATSYFVPSDISTAAFFIVLTLLSKNSELILRDVSLNETRIGILKVLKEMGGDIEIQNEKISSGEPFGDIVVKSSELKNVEIKSEIIPNIIDEIPILSVAGLFAEGSFQIQNAKELRKKESDRINSLCYNYRLLGLNVDETQDGFSISGEIKHHSFAFESFNDHRIAMAFSVLSMLLKDGAKINKFECVGISNPNFIFQLKKIVR